MRRLLVVGLGSIGRRHVRVVRRILPDIEIIALRHSASAMDAVDGIRANVRNIDDALSLKPNAALISNPASQHLPTATALVRAGIPVMIEKPLSDRPAGVQEMLVAAKMKGVPVLTAYNLRFMPSLIYLREAVQSGSIGRILSIRAEVGQYLPDWRPEVDYRRSVSALRALGGGVLLELSHEFDYLRWIFGDPEWVQAFCGHQSRLEIDVEDTAHVIIGFPNKSYKALSVASVSLDFVRRDATRTCTVIGDSGTLRWNAISGTVEDFLGGSGWRERFRHANQRDESYMAQWRHFLECVDGRAQPLISGEDGLAVLKLVEAIHVAAATGTRTPITSNILPKTTL